MFHDDIKLIPYHNHIKTKIFISKCIAKKFIWTTFKVIFSVFRFVATSASRFSYSCISTKLCPVLTNHTSMESLCIQLSDDADELQTMMMNFETLTLITGFVVQGHISASE